MRPRKVPQKPQLRRGQEPMKAKGATMSLGPQSHAIKPLFLFDFREGTLPENVKVVSVRTKSEKAGEGSQLSAKEAFADQHQIKLEKGEKSKKEIVSIERTIEIVEEPNEDLDFREIGIRGQGRNKKELDGDSLSEEEEEEGIEEEDEDERKKEKAPQIRRCSDGSAFLSLPPQTYLELSLPNSPPFPVPRWTLSMEVRLPVLNKTSPTPMMSFLQANQWNYIRKAEYEGDRAEEEKEILEEEEFLDEDEEENEQSSPDFEDRIFQKYPHKFEKNGTDGEVFFSQEGEASNFGILGRAAIQRGVWKTITIIGDAFTSSIKLFMNEHEIFSLCHNAFYRRILTTKEFSEWIGEEIEQDSKKEISLSRVSLDPSCVRLFASRLLHHMCEAPIHIRCISYWDRPISDAEIRSLSLPTIDLSKDQKGVSRQKKDQFFLAKRSGGQVPLWHDPFFLQTFGDKFQSHSVARADQALETYIQLMEQLVDEQNELGVDGQSFLSLSPADLGILRGAIHTWKQCLPIFRLFSDYARHASKQIAERWTVSLKTILSNLSDGNYFFVPLTLRDELVILAVKKNLQADTATCAVITASTQSGLMYHESSVRDPPRFQFKTSLVLKNVSLIRLCQGLFLTSLLELVRRPNLFYEWILPWLYGRPLDEALAEDQEDEIEGAGGSEFRHPALCAPFKKTLSHVNRFFMTQKGMSRASCKVVSLGLRLELLESVSNDLRLTRQVRGESDLRTLELGIRVFSHAAGRLGEQNLLNSGQLLRCRKAVSTLKSLMATVPLGVAPPDGPPSILELENPMHEQTDLFPFFDRLLRLESVDHLAPPYRALQKQVPVDFLRIPSHVTTLAEAIEALRHTDRVCMLLLMQRPRALEAAFVCSLVEHVFFSVIPIPRSRKSQEEQGGGNVWDSDMRYESQLDVMILLERLLCHYAHSVDKYLSWEVRYGIRRLLTFHCMLAIADCVLRKRATDMPSEVSMIFGGYWSTKTISHRGPAAFPKPSAKTKKTNFFSDIVQANIEEDAPFEVNIEEKPEKLQGTNGFGIDCTLLASVTTNMEIHTPEEAVVRALVLDYFSGQKLGKPSVREVDPKQIILTFDQQHPSFSLDAPTKLLISSVITKLGWKGGAAAMFCQKWPLDFNFPEWSIFKSVAIVAKMHLLKATRPNALCNLSEPAPFLTLSVGKGQAIKIYLNGSEMAPSQTPSFPSLASPAVYLETGQMCRTEDDILHLRNLPDFGGVLTASESELLLSILTTPYMRVPLVLAFFATEERIHSLRSKPLRVLFDAAVFEGGKFLWWEHQNSCPTMVPTPDKSQLGAPLGFLMNELCASPKGIMDHTRTLLRLGISLDVGTSDSASTTCIILFVLRYASRLESFVSFLLTHAQKEEGKQGSSNLRGFYPTKETVQILREGQAMLRDALWNSYSNLLGSWIRQLHRVCEPLTRATIEGIEALQEGSSQLIQSPENESLLELYTGRLCSLYAHVILSYRSIHTDLNQKKVATLLEAHFFLAKRFTWNKLCDREYNESLKKWGQLKIFQFDYLRQNGKKEDLKAMDDTWTPFGFEFPEAEVFECWQLCREKIILWLRNQNKGVFSYIFPRCVDISSGFGGAIETEEGEDDDSVFRHEWALFKEEASCGRFSQISVKNENKGCWHDEQPSTTSDALEHGTELDIQVLVVTLNNTSVQALPTECASNGDVVSIFERQQDKNGESALQAAVVEACENRMWYRIVGRDFDVQHWITQESRVDDATPLAMEAIGREYQPNGLFSSEKWILPIFEPVRRAFMTRPEPWIIYMSSKPLARNASIAYLVVLVDEKSYGCYKEILVFRHLKMVQIFMVFSYGRRFYRKMIFTSDSRFSLSEQQPSAGPRQSYWLDWERHLAGAPHQDITDGTGCLLLRATAHPENFSGGIETFLPSRLLEGLLPSVFLETHTFWQDEQDNIKGYPRSSIKKDKKVKGKKEGADYFLFVHLRNFKKVSFTSFSGVCATIYRISKKDALKSWPSLYSPFLESTLEKKEGNGEEEKEEVDPSQMRGKRPSTQEKLGIQKSHLKLLNLQTAPPGSLLFSVAHVISRLENLSYVLAWTLCDDEREPQIDLLEFPRLNLTFTMKTVTLNDGKIEKRLYSVDHSDLFICNERSALVCRLIRGLPHSLILSNENGELQILVPALLPQRPEIGDSLFSTTLVFDRSIMNCSRSWLTVRYYLYPVHVSFSFLFLPTLGSALYLAFLRSLNRAYSEACRLCPSIATDAELSKDECEIFSQCFGNISPHPDSFAFGLQLLLCLSQSPSCKETAQQSTFSFINNYCRRLSHVSVPCRVDRSDELRLLDEFAFHERDSRKEDYSTFLLVKNRQTYLTALLNCQENESEKQKSDDSPFVVPLEPPSRVKETHWIYRKSMEPLEQSFSPVVKGNPTTQVNEAKRKDSTTLMRIMGNLSSKHTIPELETDVMNTFLVIYNLFTCGDPVLFHVGCLMSGSILAVRKQMNVSHMFRWIISVLLLLCHNPNARLPNVTSVFTTQSQPPPPSSRGKRGDKRIDKKETQLLSFYRLINSAIHEQLKEGVLKPPPGLFTKNLYSHFEPNLTETLKPGASSQFKNTFSYDPFSHSTSSKKRKPDSPSSSVSGNPSPVSSSPPKPSPDSSSPDSSSPDSSSSDSSSPGPSLPDSIVKFIEPSFLEAMGFGKLVDELVTKIQLVRPNTKELSEEEEKNDRPPIEVVIGFYEDIGRTNADEMYHKLEVFAEEYTHRYGEENILFYKTVFSPRPSHLCCTFQVYHNKEFVQSFRSREQTARAIKRLVNSTPIQETIKDQRASLFTFKVLEVDDGQVAISTKDLDRPWIVTDLSDYNCSRRLLRTCPSQAPLTSNFLSSNHNWSEEEEAVMKDFAQGLIELGISVSESTAFVSSPLNSEALHLEDYISKFKRKDFGLEETGILPFQRQVENHPFHAMSGVARTMVKRLCTDVGDYAAQENERVIPRLKGLVMHIDCQEIASSILHQVAKAEKLIELKTTLARLTKSLHLIRERDIDIARKAVAFLVHFANHVPIPTQSPSSEEEICNRVSYLLFRESGQEGEAWVDFLIASLLSSRSLHDIQQLNPFVTGPVLEALQDISATVLLFANRVGHINRCLVEISSLSQLLSPKEIGGTPSKEESLAAALLQKSEILASTLTAARHYIDENSSDEEKKPSPLSGGAFKAFDPRFLVFEFTWNILLRKGQVEMVRSIYSSVKGGKSIVKQMIMGAGKTTVVGPLLCLMLADGENLVIQAVPPALLEFTRSVLRSTFSSIMQKRIFTLTFDRSCDPDTSLKTKLVDARRRKAVVVTTPTSLKSLMLKFLELVHQMESGAPQSQLRIDTSIINETLQLMQNAYLIMDEVDLILHPLRSELNFPIGERLDLDFNPLRWRLPIHLLDAVFYAERGRMSVDFNDSAEAVVILEELKKVIDQGYEEKRLQRNPHIVLLDVDFYHAHMRPILLQWLLLWINQQHIQGVSPKQIKKYLAGAVTPELSERVESKCSSKHKRLLNLGRDWLRSYMPHCLQKIDRVSFGLLSASDLQRALEADPHMPRTRAKLGIPFVGKDVPSRSSEFAHPDVIIGLTILAYRYEGLRWTDVEEIIQHLRTTMAKEPGPYSKRKSTIRYQKWIKSAGGQIRGVTNLRFLDEASPGVEENIADTDESTVISLRLLKLSNRDQMTRVFNLLSRLPETIHYYLNEFIFPQYTRHQVIKLSESGQGLGSDMLFKKPRIGFSGTPGDLIPFELGMCDYEKASDGKVVRFMTDPSICCYEIVGDQWDSRSLLRQIARKQNPPYHALIDTGALITGLTNEEVARALLAEGLEGFGGVVFLDESDQKVIVVRQTGRVVPLQECGIPLEHRFAFYDQIHTTGMDIKHVLSATAVLTLGKDMTWRDYAQGAFRMRGIGKGQRIHLMIIPEIDRAIRRELVKCDGMKRNPFSPSPISLEEQTEVLESVAAWLVINSMRSERVQFHQLCLQNVANTWRKQAFRCLMANWLYFCGVSPDQSTVWGENLSRQDRELVTARALTVFREPIDFTIASCVPKPRPFPELVENLVADHCSWVTGDEEQRVVTQVLKQVRGDEKPNQIGEEEHDAFFDGEQVREEEREQEVEQEQEQEQEIEIEKYVDLAYQRDNEAPIPWPFDSVMKSLKFAEQSSVFYPLKQFSLYYKKPLHFSEDLYMSTNYFNLRWTGERRIKNVITALEWIPSRAALAAPRIISDTERQSQAKQMKLSMDEESQKKELSKAFRVLDREGRGFLRGESLKSALCCAVDLTSVEDEVFSRFLEDFGEDMEIPPAAVVSSDDTPEEDEWSNLSPRGVPEKSLEKFLRSNQFREVENGRHLVVLSLAEAETVRRIMHHRRWKPSLLQSVEGEGSLDDVSCALRINFTAEFATLDEFHKHTEGPDYQLLRGHQCFRFFNSELHYTEKCIMALLRSLEDDMPYKRQMYYHQVTGCRRRSSKRWEETPLARVFVLYHSLQLFRIRSQGASVRAAMKSRGLLPFDVFRHFDITSRGALRPEELWGGLEWMGVDVSASDILDIFDSFDANRDGNLDYREFLEMTREPGVTLEEFDEEDGNEEEGVTTEDGVSLIKSLTSSFGEGEGLLGSMGDSLTNSLEMSGDFGSGSLGSQGFSSLGSREGGGENIMAVLKALPLANSKRDLRMMRSVLAKGKVELKKARKERIIENERRQKEKEEEERKAKKLEELTKLAKRKAEIKKFGANPSLETTEKGEHVVHFDFTKGRYPNDVSFMGSASLKKDSSGDQKSLLVAPSSCAVVHICDEFLDQGFGQTKEEEKEEEEEENVEEEEEKPSTNTEEKDTKKTETTNVTYRTQDGSVVSKEVLESIQAFKSRKRIEEYTISISFRKNGYTQQNFSPLISFSPFNDDPPLVRSGKLHNTQNSSFLTQCRSKGELLDPVSQLAEAYGFKPRKGEKLKGLEFRPSPTEIQFFRLTLSRGYVECDEEEGPKGKNKQMAVCLFANQVLVNYITEKEDPSVGLKAGPFSFPLTLNLFGSNDRVEMQQNSSFSVKKISISDKSIVPRARDWAETRHLYKKHLEGHFDFIKKDRIQRRLLREREEEKICDLFTLFYKLPLDSPLLRSPTEEGAPSSGFASFTAKKESEDSAEEIVETVSPAEIEEELQKIIAESGIILD